MLDIRPVGWVRIGVEGPKHEGWEEVVSEIVMEPEFQECLNGIEDFSHIQVLFWFHKLSLEERAKRKFRPRDREDAPIVGSFVTHSQRRPNPIGVTVVRLLERKGNVLKVQGLDALDGTPVIDIKSYSGGLDDSEDVRVPEWHRRGRGEARAKG